MEKMTKLQRGVIILLVVVALVAGVLGALFTRGCSSTPKQSAPVEQTEDTVKVPYLIHHDDADALKMLNDLGLARGKVEYKYSDKEAAGIIMSQDPKAETVVKKGTRVNIVVSKGKEAPKKVKMPDLIGKTQDEAEKALKDAKLVPVPGNPEYSDSVKPGLVCKQSIPAGTETVENSKVTFSISLGKKTVKVPDVTGKPIEEAKTTIKNAGLGVDVNTQYDAKVEKDHVIKQSIVAGTEVTEGTNITLTASLGEKPVKKVKVPDIMTYKLADAQRSLQSAGLLCEYTGDAEGTVSSVNPPVGTEVAVGSKVTITLQHVKTLVEVPDVAGMTGPQARSACELVGLTIDYDVRQPDRVLIGSEPAAGTLVDMGDIIKAKYEDPKPITVEVPDVSGMTGPTASDTLRAVGLDLDYNVRQPDDELIGTDPAAGTEVEVGTMVTAVYPDPEIHTMGSWETAVGARSLVSDAERDIFTAAGVDGEPVLVLAKHEMAVTEETPADSQETTDDQETADTQTTDENTPDTTDSDDSAALDGVDVVTEDNTNDDGGYKLGDSITDAVVFRSASLSDLPEGTQTVYAFLYQTDSDWHVATISVDNNQNVTLLGTNSIDITDIRKGGSYDDWTVSPAPQTTLVPDDAQKAFDAAYDGYVGVAFNPIATLGTQVVSGENYLILATGSSDGGVNVVYSLTVYQDAEGSAQFTDVSQLDLTSYLSL